MEEALRERISEIHRLRQEYDELYEQSRQAHSLHLEREDLLKTQLQKQQDVLQICQDKNQQLKDILRVQVEWKEHVVQEMKESQQLLSALSAAKDDVDQQLQHVQTQYYQVKKEKDALEVLVEDLQVAQITLSQQIHEYSLQQMDMDSTAKKCHALQHILEYDMIAKVQYDAMKHERDFLLHKVEHDLISKELYEEEKRAKEDLSQQIQDNFVSKVTYEALRKKYEDLNEEKQVLETTFKLVEDSREERLNAHADFEGTIKALTAQLHDKEQRVTQWELKCDEQSHALTQVRNELEAVYADLHRQHEATAQCEHSKAALNTQLGNMKLQLRRELDTKQQLQEEISKLKKQIDDNKLEFAQSLLAQQQKVHDVFAVQEAQYQDKILSLESIVHEEEQLQEEQTALEEQNSALERELQGMKTQLAIHAAYQEHSSKEIHDCKNTIIALQDEKALLHQKNEDLQHVIEDFRMAIMTELSPSFKHFYVQPHLLAGSRSSTPQSSSGSFFRQDYATNSSGGNHQSGVGRQLSRDELQVGPLSPPPPPFLRESVKLADSPVMSAQKSTSPSPKKTANVSFDAVAATALSSPVVKVTEPSNTSSGPTSHLSNPNAIQLTSQQARVISKSPSPMGRNGGVVVNTEVGGKLVIDPSLPSISLPRTNTTPTRLRPVAQLSSGSSSNPGTPTSNSSSKSSTAVSPRNSKAASSRGRFQQTSTIDSWRSPVKPSSLPQKQQTFAMTKHVVPRVRITASSSMDNLSVQDIELSPSLGLKSSSSSASSSPAV